MWPPSSWRESDRADHYIQSMGRQQLAEDDELEHGIDQRVAFGHKLPRGWQPLDRTHAQPDQQHGDGDNQPGQRAGRGNRQQMTPVAHRAVHGDHRAQRSQRRHR